MRHIASLFILMLLIGTASANQGTITIYGTNASNAQSNLTRVGTNATVNVSAWAIGDAVKTFTVNVSDLNDINAFVLGNFTVGRIIEVKVNGTSYNAYLANAQGEITFNRTQNNRNQTYTATPALNANYNLSWIAVNGVMNPYLPLAGGTMTGQLLGTTIGAIDFANSVGTVLIGTGAGVSTTNLNIATGLLYFRGVSTNRPTYSNGAFVYNTTTNSLEVAGDNNQWVSLNHFRNITSTGNSSGKVKDTVYQNSNSTPMFVNIVGYQSNTAASLFIGLTSTPSQLCELDDAVGTARFSVVCIIPPMYYYRFTTSVSGEPTYDTWMEIQ